MIDSSRLSAFYSFWTNTNLIDPSELERKLSDYGYIVETTAVSDKSYFILGSASGEPLLYFGINSEFKDNLPLPDHFPAESLKTYKYHCNILTTPSGELSVHFAALALMKILAETYEGTVLDLAAQRILSLQFISEILAKNKFKIENHTSLHFVEDKENNTSWLHSHGMEKFGLLNIETFEIQRERLIDARQLFNDLLHAFVFGRPPKLNAPVKLPSGEIALMYSSDVRPYLPDHLAETVRVHNTNFHTLVDFNTAGDINSACTDYFFRKLLGNSAVKIPADSLDISLLSTLPPDIELFTEFLTDTDDRFEIIWGKINIDTKQILVLTEPAFKKEVSKGDLIPLDSAKFNFFVAIHDGKTLSFDELTVKLNILN